MAFANVNGFGVILGGLEPARQSHFALNILRSPAGAFGQDGQYALKSFNPGAKVVDADTYQLLNRIIRYPKGRGALPDASMTLIVYNGGSVYDGLWSWFTKVYDDRTDTVGLLLPGGGIGGDAEVSVCGPDGSPFLTVQLLDIWPNKFGLGGLDRGSDGEPAMVEVGFVVNEWRLVS